jgi:hypothetical protein
MEKVNRHNDIKKVWSLFHGDEKINFTDWDNNSYKDNITTIGLQLIKNAFDKFAPFRSGNGTWNTKSDAAFNALPIADQLILAPIRNGETSGPEEDVIVKNMDAGDPATWASIPNMDWHQVARIWYKLGSSDKDDTATFWKAVGVLAANTTPIVAGATTVTSKSYTGEIIGLTVGLLAITGLIVYFLRKKKT